MIKNEVKITCPVLLQVLEQLHNFFGQEEKVEEEIFQGVLLRQEHLDTMARLEYIVGKKLLFPEERPEAIQDITLFWTRVRAKSKEECIELLHQLKIIDRDTNIEKTKYFRNIETVLLPETGEISSELNQRDFGD